LSPFKINNKESAVAKPKYVVAQAVNLIAGKAKSGQVLGQFRKIEFARQARDLMQREASKRKILRIGIFFNGVFVESI